MSICPGWGRHWFVIRGTVGLRSPVCVRCFTPNPRRLTREEWAALIAYRDARGYPLNDRIEAEIRKHQEN